MSFGIPLLWTRFIWRRMVFYSYQPKTFAYPILFLALTCIIRNRFLESTILLGITTHIHFLIGGWFFLFSIIFMIVKKGFCEKKFFNYFIIYVIITIPLTAYILKNYFIIVDLENFKNFPSADWIYASFGILIIWPLLKISHSSMECGFQV